MLLSRRDFGRSVVASSLALGSATQLHADEVTNRLAVSTWSFHNYFPNTRYGKPEFVLEEWKVEDVIRRVKEKLGITAIEMSSAHFASFDSPYLDRLNAFLKDVGCRFIHLSDNMRGVNLAQSDREKREGDLKKFQDLIEIAQRFKIPTMRVNTGTPEAKDWDLKITIDCYQRLAKFGKERGVEIIIENHFGISADPKNVVRIIEAVGENISACPDFGLFKNEDERRPGLELMFSKAKRMCSAKFHGFDDGKPRDFDLKRCYEILKAAKYPGWISLEYEGPREPVSQLEPMKKLAIEWLK